MEEIRVVQTEDGSHTLFNPFLNETYHSSRGALTESLHVFIKNGLEYYSGNFPQKTPVRIFEMGFGTGLNAVLAGKFANEHGLEIEYQTIEVFPLEMSIISRLNYFDDDPARKDLFYLLHSLSWNVLHEMQERFFFKKLLLKIEDHIPEEDYFDIIFYDAFAPGKQGEVWSIDILEKTVGSLCEEGIFVTYCAKGQLKRDLKELGCEVHTLPGPPGKKEMVRAIKKNKPFQA